MELLHPLRLFIKALLYEIDRGCARGTYADVNIVFANEDDVSLEMGRLFQVDNPFIELMNEETVQELKEIIEKRIDTSRPFCEKLRDKVKWHGQYPFEKVFLCWVTAVAVDLMGEIE